MTDVILALVSVITASVGLILKKLFAHEHRLTRMETKLDLFLACNGIDSDCPDKGDGGGKVRKYRLKRRR